MTSRISLLAVGLLAASVAVGCSNGSGSSGAGQTTAGSTGSTTGGQTGSTGSTGGAVLPSAPPAGVWLKGDLHVHTAYSPDADQYGDEVYSSIKMAEYAGLDFVVLGDHRQTRVRTDPLMTQTQTPLVVIPGMEWGGGGHAGAHGYITDPPFMTQTGADAAQKMQSIQDVIAHMDAEGGVFVLNHPMDRKNPFVYPVTGFHGIEIWNQMWSWRQLGDWTAQGIIAEGQGKGLPQAGLAVPQEMVDATVYTGGGYNYQALKFWEEHLNRGRHLAAIGGGDRHYLVLPGTPTTEVFATQATQQGVLEGIREARTIVKRAPDAPRVDFTADGNGDGVFESIIGDSIPLGQAVTFQVRVSDALGGKVHLIKNGQVMQNWPVTQYDETFVWTDTATAQSWYRVDVYEPLDMSFPNASLLKYTILGVQGQGWLTNLTSGSGFLGSMLGWLGNVVNQVQDAVETGAPAAIWLVVYGSQAGIQTAPVPSRFPVFEWPENVSRVLNLDLHDTDFCRGAMTSPIWVE